MHTCCVQSCKACVLVRWILNAAELAVMLTVILTLVLLLVQLSHHQMNRTLYIVQAD